MAGQVEVHGVEVVLAHDAAEPCAEPTSGSPLTSDSDGAPARGRVVDSRCVLSCGRLLCQDADDAAAPGSSWLVGALNGFNCRLVGVSVTSVFGAQRTLRVACDQAQARTAADTDTDPTLEQLCKQVSLQSVSISFTHAGAVCACTRVHH